MPERDHPALWESAEWLVGLEAWLVPALATHGIRVTAPVVRDRVRFWSVVARVETDAGRVWVKENAPSQAFEAGLVALVDRVLPGVVAPLLAVDTERGWLASADLGLPMWHDETPPPVEDWVAVMSGYAGAQRSLSAHEDEVLAVGVARFPEDPDEVVGWVTDVLATLRALPRDDPRRPTDAEAGLVEDGLGRIHDAAAVLTASGLPPSLQHNDLHLGNAFRRPDGGVAYIDLGDALWTHPLTTLRIPLWIMRHRFSLDPGGPELRRAVDAYLEPWTDAWDVSTLRALLPHADRVSCLHRAESWRRLQADVPLHRVDEEFRRSVTGWLLDAAAPDPYASAVAR